MTIRIVTVKDGKKDLDTTAKPATTLAEICELADNEVLGGYADKATVYVNGKVHLEREA